MIQYTLRQLAYFVAAAERGSIAEAARALNVSQPSVSTAVAKLEDSFGVSLFLRHHAQGVSLTPVGERLMIEARSLLAYAGELQQSARELGQGARGQINVGCFVTIGPMYMPNLVMRFTTAHPNAEIRLHEGYQQVLLDGLRRGAFDVAIMYDVELPDDLEVTPLLESPPYVLLPAGHPLAARDEVSLRDLAAEPMVVLDQPPSRAYFTGLFRDHGLEPTVAFNSPSLEMVRALVGNGHGFSILVTRPSGDLAYDGRGLAVRPLAEPVEPGRIVLARLAQTRAPRLVEAFAEFTTDYFMPFIGKCGAARPPVLPQPALSSNLRAT